MFKQNALVAAIAVALLSWSYPQNVSAETFRSADFLKWPEDSQSFYFRTSIGMAGLIAARNDKKHSDCVDRWYVADTKKVDAKIIAVMRDNPEFHPQAVILAMLQKACGSFTY